MSSFILLIIMGLIMSFAIYSIKFKYKALTRGGVKVKGTLTDYEETKSNNKIEKIPVVQFSTIKKELVEKKTDKYYLSSEKKGSKVIVFYNPDTPDEFLVIGKNFDAVSRIMIGVGILFSLTGIILLLNYTGVLKLFK
ncbi:MAG: DUF3592 domain-containing protein [Bacteroidetes bacterium]|nr:DUF3592 domain-containing protein [Bacteroidota bacterium]